VTAELATLFVLAGVWLLVWGLAGGLLRLSWSGLEARTRDWHPADRAALLLALALSPIALPTMVVLLGVAPGLAGVLLPALDHCAAHPDHVHLCLVHPTAALTPVLTALVLVAFLTLLMGGLSRAVGLFRARRALPAIPRDGAPSRSAAVRLLASDRPFAWTVGWLRPRTLVSTTLARALSASELEVVLAHEGEHVRRRDPLRRLLAGLGTRVAGARVQATLLRAFDLATERACDEAAAGFVGDRLRVAQAILSVEAMVIGDHPEGAVAVGMGGSSVAARVESLLAPPRALQVWPGRRVGLVGVLALGLAAQIVHHQLEHLITLVAMPGA